MTSPRLLEFIMMYFSILIQNCLTVPRPPYYVLVRQRGAVGGTCQGCLYSSVLYIMNVTKMESYKSIRQKHV